MVSPRFRTGTERKATTKDKLDPAHTHSGRSACAARSVDQSTAVVGDTSGRRCAFGTTGADCVVCCHHTFAGVSGRALSDARKTEGDFVEWSRPECLATGTFRQRLQTFGKGGVSGCSDGCTSSSTTSVLRLIGARVR